jgi:hypothetical protein
MIHVGLEQHGQKLAGVVALEQLFRHGFEFLQVLGRDPGSVLQ